MRTLPIEQDLDKRQQHDLLRRLRWISIGRQYNWTLKEYSDASEEIPEFVKALCEKLSKMAGLGEFKAEAGIANFYQPGDSLTAHVDRSEKNMTVPLVSVSAGASCAFVLGGESREDEPVGLLLHSGI